MSNRGRGRFKKKRNFGQLIIETVPRGEPIDYTKNYRMPIGYISLAKMQPSRNWNMEPLTYRDRRTRTGIRRPQKKPHFSLIQNRGTGDLSDPQTLLDLELIGENKRKAKELLEVALEEANLANKEPEEEEEGYYYDNSEEEELQEEEKFSQNTYLASSQNRTSQLVDVEGSGKIIELTTDELLYLSDTDYSAQKDTEEETLDYLNEHFPSAQKIDTSQEEWLMPKPGMQTTQEPSQGMYMKSSQQIRQEISQERKLLEAEEALTPSGSRSQSQSSPNFRGLTLQQMKEIATARNLSTTNFTELQSLQVGSRWVEKPQYPTRRPLQRITITSINYRPGDAHISYHQDGDKPGRDAMQGTYSFFLSWKLET